MKILIAVHLFFPEGTGGTEAATRDAALELVDRGHEVEILTVNPTASRTATGTSIETYEHDGLTVHSIILPPPRSPVESIRRDHHEPRIPDVVARLLDRFDPELVHMFHMARLTASFVDLVRSRGIPIVFTATDFWLVCPNNRLTTVDGAMCSGPSPSQGECLRCRGAERWTPGVLPGEQLPPDWFEDLAAQAAGDREVTYPDLKVVRAALERRRHLADRFEDLEVVFAPTRFLGKQLEANGVPAELIRHSPYGLRLDRFEQVRERRRRTEQLRFGYIGSIAPHKGVDLVVEAFRSLRSERPVSLRIVGDLDAAADYGEQLYAAAAGDDRINFTGLIDSNEIPDQLAEVDVLVTPSTWYENAPLTISQAFTSGIPVIATDLGGMSEIVVHEVNGLLFPVGDSDALREQMTRLAEDRGLYEQLAGRTEVHRRSSDLGDELEAFYSEVLERPRKDRPARRPPGELSGNGSAPSVPQPTERDQPAPRRPTIGTREPGTDPEIFFVIGRAKSGTSWARQLVGLHPAVLCRSEGRFAGRDYLLGDTGVGSLQGSMLRSPRLAAWAANSIWTQDREWGELSMDLAGGLIRHVLGTARDPGGRLPAVVGDKTPLTGPDMVAELDALVPGCKIIHVIRDGRDVAVSAAHHVWNQDTDAGGVHELTAGQRELRELYREDPEEFKRLGHSIFTPEELHHSATDWETLTRAARRQGLALGERYLELRYEEMLDDPTRELRKAFALLGVDTNGAIIERCVERASFQKMTGGRKRGEEVSSDFRRKGIAGDWIETFTEHDRELFRDLAGSLLVELGYEQPGSWWDQQGPGRSSARIPTGEAPSSVSTLSAAEHGSDPAEQVIEQQRKLLRRGAAGGRAADAPASSPFFVTGVFKSGTSWMMWMLDAHPEIFCKAEGQIVGDYLRPEVESEVIPPSTLARAIADSSLLQDWLARSPWGRHTGMDDDQLSAFVVRQIASGLMGHRAARGGAAWFGDKTPLLSAETIGELATTFPGSPLIHVIRDGRDVAVSAVHHLWNEPYNMGWSDPTAEEREIGDAYRADPEGFVGAGRSLFTEGRLIELAEGWSSRVLGAQRQGAELGDDYREVRYEVMLERPHEEVSDLLSWLGVPSSARVVEEIVEGTSFSRLSGGRDAGDDRSDQFVRKGVAGDWANVMTPRDIELFESIAGEALSGLGYIGSSPPGFS